MTTIYVTKYALTQGIFAIEAEILEGGYASQSRKSGEALKLFLSKSDYALTKDEALEKAEVLRKRKLVSIARTVNRIKSLDFTKMV